MTKYKYLLIVSLTLISLTACGKKPVQDSKYIRITKSITALLQENKTEAAYYRMSEDFRSLTTLEDFQKTWTEASTPFTNPQKVLYTEADNKQSTYSTVTVDYKNKKSHLYSTFLFSEGSSLPIDVFYSITKPEAKTVSNADNTGLKDLCASYFKLGCGLTGYSKETCAVNLPDYMAITKQHFSSCTMTNLMKPAYILNQQKCIASLKNGNGEPALDYTAADKTLKWCLDNNVQMRGHTLVWHTQVPDWFFTVDYHSGSQLVSRETMISRMDSMIGQYMTYVQDNYPGVVYCWDVVNEAVDPVNGDNNSFFHCRTSNDGNKNYWYYTIGEDYPEQAFISARKYAAPGVSLFYNDYGTTDKAKREYIYKLCKSLKEKGLIDGIGMQAYWDNKNPSLKTIAETINYYAELGLEIQLTEWSMNADSYDEKGLAQQAERYASIFRLLQKLDTQGGGKANITCVSFFGVMDSYKLYQNDTTNCRIFDKNLKPKPVFYTIKDTMELLY